MVTSLGIRRDAREIGRRLAIKSAKERIKGYLRAIEERKHGIQEDAGTGDDD